MLFSTPLFLYIFFPCFLLFYFLMPKRIKNVLIFLGSFAFFAWGEPVFSWVVLFSAIFDWLLASCMIKKQGKFRFWLALVGVVGNVSILVYYKYTSFLLENINYVLSTVGWQALSFWQVLLPIGVSFITFEKITYIVDIYKGNGKHSESLLNYLVYVFLFPKLLAGPIVKYHEIEAQLDKHETTFPDFYLGMGRFVLGMAKKVFVADSLAEYVDVVFGMPAVEIATFDAWYAALAFMLQIYFDFSGYSDMALGMARMFGFRFRENFNLPYISRSFSEFWERWNISLSTWIREYVYIPLGGSRVRKLYIYRNLTFAMLVSGIWHGANWTFVAWAIFHSFFLSMDRLFLRKTLLSINPAIAMVINSFFLLLSLVMFRAPDVMFGLAYWQTMFSWHMEGTVFVYTAKHIDFFFWFAMLCSFVPIFGYERWKVMYMNWRFRWFVEPMIILSLAVIVFLKVSTTVFNPFLYFRF